MQKKQSINGRILYTSGQALYLSRGPNIYHSYDGGENWHLWVKFPVSLWARFAMYVPILVRFFRLGVHHLTFVGDKAVAIVNKKSFLVERNRVISLGSLCGSRPLVLCATNDAVYYGEYRSNSERMPVHIWMLNFTTLQWQSIWTFDDVRHVHGVFYDQFTETIWVTTGDSNEESAIWCTADCFATLEKIKGGAQQFRAVQLLFSNDYIYFGSDAPDQQNHIYRIDRSNNELNCLVSVGGPVFFGCRVGGSLCFSTSVEPSSVNTAPFVEIWRTVNGESWERILQFKKDRYPMKYFQYGQVFFPNGPSVENILFCTPFATKSHGLTFKYTLDKVNKS